MDATNTNRLGKFVNDTTKVYANAKMRQIEISEVPRICLFALSDLPKEIENRYDYQAPGLWWRKAMLIVFIVFSFTK